MSFFGVLGVDFAGASGISCLWEVDYVDELLIQTLLPAIIAMLLLFVRFVNIRYYTFQFSADGDTDKLEEQLRRLNAQYIQLFLTLTYLLLTSTVNKIFRMFPCDNVDPDNSSEGSDVYLRVFIL